MKKAMKNSISMYEPNPTGFEVCKYDPDDKERIIKYMQSYVPYAVAGRITDCVTGERLKKEDVGYTDGEYMWTSQDIYHIQKYNAAVTDGFFQKIMQ